MIDTDSQHESHDEDDDDEDDDDDSCVHLPECLHSRHWHRWSRADERFIAPL